METVESKKSMTDKVRRWIGSQYPPLRCHLVDLHDTLSHGLWLQALKYNITLDGQQVNTFETVEENIDVTYVIDDDDFCSVVFYNKTLLEAVSDTVLISVDGTFQVVPKIPGCFQLLTLMTDVNNKVIE